VVTAVYGPFDPATNTGVVSLNECGPNGSTVGSNDNLLLGCTPGNQASNTSTLVINAKTKHFANIGGITGSDEVFFNAGDKRYYTASSADPTGAVMGVINAETNLLIETIPQSSGSHSIAADSKRNRIYVPQSASDTTTVGAGICGVSTGCIAVYQHDVDDEDGRRDHRE
jgi:DNA-binding beta-propeller fold protein YncE